MEEEKKSLDIGEILNLIKEVWSKSIWPFKWAILILALAFASWAYFKENSKPITYYGGTNFMLESEDITGQSAIEGNMMLSSFMGSNKSNKNILMALFISNKMKELTLLSKAVVDGEEDLLINHFKRINGDKPDSSGSYGFDSSFKYGESPKKDAYLRQVANSFASPQFDIGITKQGLFYLLYESKNEDFTLSIIRNHINGISEYYFSKRLEKARIVLEFSEKHRNDIKKKLASAEYGLASLMDRSNGAFMYRALSQKSKYERQVEVYNEMYLNAEITYHSAKVNMLKKTPYIQIIDDARAPLRISENKPVLKAITFFIVFFVFGIAVCVGIYFLRDFIKKQKAIYQQSTEA
jgi:hypothetical protein